MLGRSVPQQHYQKHETDLVIIVTPHLVQPAAPGQRLATPLDQRLPSNDVDFFVFGQSEMRKKYDAYETRGWPPGSLWSHHSPRAQPKAPVSKG